MILLPLILLTSGIINPSFSRKIKSKYLKYWEEDESEIRSIRAGPDQNPKCNETLWPVVFPACSGLFQSPINIPKNRKVSEYKTTAALLCWRNYDEEPLETSLNNRGYTIEMIGKWRRGRTPTISCGVLGKKVYEFAQWHCHWSNTNSKGSEHTFNGKYYPMECHFVHFNRAYGNITNALQYRDGLAVIGYVYEIEKRSTFPGELLGRALLRMANQNREKVDVLPLPLSSYAPSFTKHYATYPGSLTTPPCSESVIWIVSIKPRRVTRLLLKKFRAVATTSECMIDNYRDIQALNGRDVQIVRSHR